MAFNTSSIEISARLPLYGPLNIEDLETYYINARKRFANTYQKACPFVVKKEDYDLLSLLGEGAFGKVILVRDKKTESYYAMKALEKRHIVNMKQVKHALNEKRILQCIDFPFGVRMEYFSKDNSYIYFIMPFISGGELFTHLQKVGKFDEKNARFYAAQVVLGLDYLHQLKLVYRDLKPENLLLDHLGYLKITDFGFTKPVLSRTYTFCGTPAYLAPEVIEGHGYGSSVDWWSLGVLIYELASGRPPFDAPDPMSMFKRILNNRYAKPKFFSPALKNIVNSFLEPDVTLRLGNLKNRASDVMKHEWFAPVDWIKLFNRQVKASFVPSSSGQGDVSNFDTTQVKGSIIKVSTENEFEEEFKDF